MKSLCCAILVSVCATLLSTQTLLAEPQGYGHWHYGITHRPRLLYLADEVNTIKSRLTSGIYQHLWSNSFFPRHSQETPLYGIFQRADDDPLPRPNRGHCAEAAQIAKNAAFVYAMGVDANGADLGGQRDFYKNHALGLLRILDPDVWGDDYRPLGNIIKEIDVLGLFTIRYSIPGTEVLKVADWLDDHEEEFDNLQWRAKELIQYCQAYDMLLGAGVPREKEIDRRLCRFASNLYYFAECGASNISVPQKTIID